MTTRVSLVDQIEEKLIAVILGLMTALTFANVVARYAFDSNILWALEMTVFLFAWLVLLGAAYAVKKGAHLGVDLVVNMLDRGARKLMALAAVAVCLAFAFLMMKGSWDYWANFANLPQTTGRWFPTGFEEMKRTSYRGWYEVVDIPMPEWLRWIEPLMNEGEEYEKIPRFIPYFILPFGMALLLFRFVQAFVRVWTGQSTSLIVSHEAEDAIEDVRHMNAGD